jgi:hypothetical protein
MSTAPGHADAGSSKNTQDLSTSDDSATELETESDREWLRESMRKQHLRNHHMLLQCGVTLGSNPHAESSLKDAAYNHKLAPDSQPMLELCTEVKYVSPAVISAFQFSHFAAFILRLHLDLLVGKGFWRPILHLRNGDTRIKHTNSWSYIYGLVLHIMFAVKLIFTSLPLFCTSMHFFNWTRLWL